MPVTDCQLKKEGCLQINTVIKRIEEKNEEVNVSLTSFTIIPPRL